MEMEYIGRDFDIAYETARKLAQNDCKLLFISTDILQCAGYHINNIKSMTSDTITALKADKNNIFRNAMHCLIHDGNIDLFPVFPGHLWEYDINKELYGFMIKEAADTGIYDYIVVDNHEWDVFTLLTAPKDKAFIISEKNDYSKHLAESVKNHSDNELNVISEASVDEVYKKYVSRVSFLY